MSRRSYVRMEPNWAEKLEAKGYPDGAIVAFDKVIGAAEAQNPRGTFKNALVLRGHLGRHARWIAFLMKHGDLVKRPDGTLYVDGWEEWQEGNWPVAERMRRVRDRRNDRNGGYGLDRNAGDAEERNDSDGPDRNAPVLTRARPEAVSREAVSREAVDGRVTARPAADGLTTEHPSVQRYVERWMSYAARAPSAADLEFARRIPYEFPRLGEGTVLEAITEVATKHTARQKPVPRLTYLAGKLADLNAAAADAGIGQRTKGSGMARIGDLLPKAAPA